MNSSHVRDSSHVSTFIRLSGTEEANGTGSEGIDVGTAGIGAGTAVASSRVAALESCQTAAMPQSDYD